MPAVVPLVVAAASAVASSGAFLSVAMKIGASVALSFLSNALAPRPDKSDFGSFNSIRSTGVTQQFSQPITDWRIVYGEMRTSGPVIYPVVTDGNKYLHMVLVLAAHEIEEISEVVIDDVSIPLDHIDASGNVTSGKFAGLCRVKKHLGDQTAADIDLVAEVDEWESSAVGYNKAYMYVRFKWDRNKFASGIPNISAWIKGKKVSDPRDVTTKWSPNLSLCARDYLVDESYGHEADNIDDVGLSVTANLCEEFVTTSAINFNVEDINNDILTLEGENLILQTGDIVQLVSGSISGLSLSTDYYAVPYQRQNAARIKLASSLEDALSGNTLPVSDPTNAVIRKNAEPRYFGGGLLKTSSEKGNNLKEICTSMAGSVVYSGGVWRINAGSYQSPTIAFAQGDLIGGITVDYKVSRRDRFNRVQGVYLSPINNGNPSDYPLVKNDFYESQDGGKKKAELDLSFVQRPHTAQRIAKIYLERMRQEITFRARFKLTAFKIQVNDNFYFTFDHEGWENKVFEVVDWAIGVDANSVPYIDITARENAPEVYYWNNGEETAVDLAPNTVLDDPFAVDVVGGFSLSSIPVYTQDLDRIYNVLASWETPENQHVASGGKFEIEFKESTETVFKSGGVIDGSVTEMRIPALAPDTLYDIRIFAFNMLGVRSEPTLISGFLVGTTITTNTEDWENETTARDGDDWENDALPAEDWEI